MKTSLLLFPLVFILAISIPNSPTYQILAQSSNQSNEQSFASSFQSIVKSKTRLLAQDYDIQVQKWQRGELSNETMASTTDTYLPRYQELITKTKDLRTPTNYENEPTLMRRVLNQNCKAILILGTIY